MTPDSMITMTENMRRAFPLFLKYILIPLFFLNITAAQDEIDIDSLQKDGNGMQTEWFLLSAENSPHFPMQPALSARFQSKEVQVILQLRGPSEFINFAKSAESIVLKFEHGQFLKIPVQKISSVLSSPNPDQSLIDCSLNEDKIGLLSVYLVEYVSIDASKQKIFLSSQRSATLRSTARKFYEEMEQ